MKLFSYIILLLAAWATAPDPVRAEAAYPSRPVRFIVPIGPGSGGDTAARAFANQFRVVSGQPAFVENRSGADMLIGTQNLLASPPDGYSVLLVSNGAMVISPMLVKDLPYTSTDLLPIMALSRGFAVIVTGPQSRFKSLADLLAAAREKPGTVSVGVYGTSYRLGLLNLARLAGVQFNVILYRGGPQAVTDAVGGSIDAVLVDSVTATQLVATGKLRALAVTSDKRTSAMPDVPTVQESVVPGYTLYIYLGFAVHARTPPAIVESLEALMLRTMASPELRTALQFPGVETLGVGRQGFGAMIEEDAARLRDLMRVTGADVLTLKP